MKNLLILLLLFKLYHRIDNQILDIKNFIKNNKKKYDKIIDIIMNSNFEKIDIKNIPECLKDKIIINKVKIKNYSKKNVVTSILKKMKNTKFSNSNITIIDYLEYYSKYYIPPHTDIEWRAVDNTGYQVWYLKKNKNNNNRGNIFILVNDYIDKKYAKEPYSLNLINNNVYLFKNNVEHVKNDMLKKIFNKKVPETNLLEKFTLKWFIKNTKIYYLNIKEGDFIAFDKNTCHMSDICGSKRHSINFRVIDGKIKIKKKNDGFIKNNDFFYIK